MSNNSTVYWIAITPKWSSGPSTPEYRLSLTPWCEESISEVRSEFQHDNSWSEHYRGVDIDTTPAVPTKVVTAQTQSLIRDIRYKSAVLCALLNPPTQPSEST